MFFFSAAPPRMHRLEKHALQLTIALGGCVPVSAGLWGIFKGASLFEPVILPLSTNNHMVYLSGVLLGIGLAFQASIPSIEQHTKRIRLLTFLVFTGGLARLWDCIAHGTFTPGTQFALAMELLITPGICAWQSKVARFEAGRVCFPKE